MKKNKKSTDAILKDIFDPIAWQEVSEPLQANRIEKILKEEPVVASPTTDKILTAPRLTQDVSGAGSLSLRTLILWVAVGLLLAGAAVGAGCISAKQAVLRMQKSVIAEQKKLAAFQKQRLSEKNSLGRLKERVSAVMRQRQSAAATVNFIQPTWIPAAKSTPLYGVLSRMRHDSVWFESVYLKNKKILIRGFALDQVSLLKWVNGMNSQPHFKNSRLFSLEDLRSSAGRELYFFEVYTDVRV